MKRYKTITLPSIVISNPTDKEVENIRFFGAKYYADPKIIKDLFDGVKVESDDKEISYQQLLKMIFERKISDRDIFGFQISSANYFQLSEKLKEYYVQGINNLEYQRSYGLYIENYTQNSLLSNC
jgi:hypothetical protein